jgi:outer membrane immunogenic protein
VLVYATGGAAWLHVESTSTCSTNPNEGNCRPGLFSPSVIAHETTRTGWTIGGGVEAALWSNWIARGEYRYADFGTITNTDTRIGPAAHSFTYDLAVKTHTALLGLAYKFGDPVTTAAASAMPVKSPVLKAPATVASWSGLYAGAGLGVRSTQTDMTVTDFSFDGGLNNLRASCAISVALGGCVTGAPLNDTAFRFSPYVGLNWHAAPYWVLGLEGDFGWARKSTTFNGASYPAINFMSGLPVDSFSVRTTWDASARGRVGYLVTPGVLVYATGGAAWLRVEATSNCGPETAGFGGAPCANGDLPNRITHSVTKTGWTIGGGIEAGLWSNWIARAEYRYADYGTITNTDFRTGGFGIVPGLTVTYDLAIRTHTAMLGLAYKLDWLGPVVAKY